MREYWDRFIRNDTHLENVVLYIHQNPVKAGLCQRAEEWPWSSAGTPTSPSAATHRSANEDVGAPSPSLNPSRGPKKNSAIPHAPNPPSKIRAKFAIKYVNVWD
jgi:hypothetical protein